MKRLGTIVSLAVAAIAAAGVGIASCSSTNQPTTCTPGASQCNAGDACTQNIDCKAGLTCDQGTKKCATAFVCTADAQCTADRLAACSTAGACVCLDGSCQLRGCSSDALCPSGQVCLAGKCDTKPASTGLKCSILTPPSVVRQGQTLAMTAVAVNANGANVAGQSFTWTSSNTAAAAIDASGVVTGGSTTGTTNVTCKVVGGDSADSSAVVVQNYANVAAGSIRVVVVDSRSGAPIANATVQVMQAGGLLGTAQQTAADGTASVVGTGTVDVHVGKAGYTFVSAIGVAKNDLLIPLNPTPNAAVAGGFAGTFDLSQVTNKTDTVEFGLAGASLAGPFIDLDFLKLIGESIKSHVQIGTLVNQDVGLPSGLYLKLGDQNIKNKYQALAEAGKRDAWGIGGKVPFDKLLQVLTPLLGGGGASVDNLPIGQLLAQILPFFDKFRHFVKTDVQITEVPRVTDVNDINGNMSTTDLVPDFASATGFPTVNAVVNQSLSLSTSVTVPDLPRYNSKFLEGAVVLAGANVVGRGLVPLGISAAVDAPTQGEMANGKIDTDAATAGDQSTMSFKMAPLHDGLEGSKFFVAVLALSLKFSGGGVGGTTISGIIAQPDSIGTSTDLGGQTFLGFPETAAFNLANRSFSLGTAVSGANLYRADFKTSGGDWTVYFKAPASGAAFTLPNLGVGTDRAVLTTGCAGGAASCTSLRVYSMKTKASGSASAPALDDLVGFGTVNLSRLNDFVGAFSNAGCQANGSCAPATN